MTANYHLTTNEHISVETYYRFLIQDILPEYDKVLYLDGDIICKRDVADLFRTDITGYMLAAAHDPDLVGQLNLPGSKMLSYLIHKLKMENPYDYFQAGVLLLNTKEMRSTYTLQQWLTFSGEEYKYSDQDVLNRYCQGRVRYIDMAWNTLIDCNNYRVPVIIKAAIGDISRDYHIARQHPYIIHYAGFQKPWNCHGVDFECEFWQNARQSPFYEQLLVDLCVSACNMQAGKSLPNIGVRGALKIFIHKNADRYFPKGTRRRKIIKKLFGWIIK